MNFKRYHESKNLLHLYKEGYALDANGNEIENSEFSIYQASVSINELQYILTGTAPEDRYIRVHEFINNTWVHQIVVDFGSQLPFRLTKSSTTNRLLISINNNNNNMMLAVGSTILPYEPYGYLWSDIPYYIHNTSTDTITTLPADIYANGNNATVGLKGNTVQSGTPTPTTPIQPQSCGERTGNLAHNNREKGYYLDTTTGLPVAVSSTTFKYWCFMTPIAKVESRDKFILSIDIPNNINFWFQYSIVDNGVMQARSAGNGNKIAVTLQNSGDLYISCYAYNSSESIIDEAMKTIMINFGSKVLPYEPYGVKIPILSNSTTTPVYLGEVQTVRKTVKAEFSGTENWQLVEVSATNRYFNIALQANGFPLAITSSPKYSSHFNSSSIVFTGNGAVIRLYDNSGYFTTETDFKSFLAAQYAAGTPVTVWYVLATEETGIVNEPLRKIGTYADEVSGVSIPVTAGTNTLSVDTTVQPSEVTVNYKGWHPITDVHEAENGQWD